jgi:hypothetical protein
VAEVVAPPQEELEAADRFQGVAVVAEGLERRRVASVAQEVAAK